MIAFELDDAFPVVEFLRNLNIIRPALSLGGVESSVCVPATTSHRDVPPSELAASGITPQVIRLSVGIEAIDDLKSDFEKAISNSQSSAKQIVGSH
jgi:cystathionine beta-lyase